MPGANTLSEGMTFVGSRMARSDDGKLETRVDTKGPDGQDYQIVLDGDASAVIKDIHPGDKVGSFIDKNTNIGLVNEKNGAVSFHDKSGHYHTETPERSGEVVEKHHHNNLPDDHPGARANSLILDDKHHIRLPPGKDSEAVINSVHEGDDVKIYRDAQNHPVVYNETQRTVSRRDEHGQYTTEPQQEQTFKGELTKITRDPKNPDRATLEMTDQYGIPSSVEVRDTPQRRVDALMKPGDMIEATTKDVSPGKADISVADRTRHVSYYDDHNGNIAVETHPRSRPENIPGVTHQGDKGPPLPTAPGADYNGALESVKNDDGVVKIKYSDVMGKSHTIAIDSKEQSGLANASLDHLHPPGNVQLEFKKDGSFELTDYQSKEVMRPGRDGGVEVTPLQMPGQTQAQTVGGRG